MSRHVKRAKKFVRGRRFLTAAVLTMLVVGLGAFAGSSFLANATTAVNGDATCGYSGGFTESTVVQWAQVNGSDPATATFGAFATDENSMLLGVNPPVTTFPGSPPQHATPANGGDDSQVDGSGRVYFPALYITPVSGPGTWTKPGDPIPQAAGDWQNGGKVWNDPNHSPYVDDVFGTWVTGTQTIAPRNAPGNIGNTAVTLTQNVQYGPTNGTYSLATSALSAAVFTGDSIKLINGGNNQTLVAAAPAAKGDTSITVKTFKAGKTFASGTTSVNDITSAAGDYARVTTLPSQQSGWSTANLGAGSDVPTAGFSNLFFEKYITEFRWNISGLHDPTTSAALQPGGWYKIQIIEHDGDQNKAGGDSGEFCTLVKIPGPPPLTTDPTGGTDPNGTHIDAAIAQPIGTTIHDTAFLSKNTGFPNVTGKVNFHLYFWAAGTEPANSANACVAGHEVTTGGFPDTEGLDSSADPSRATSVGFDTSTKGLGTYYWQDVYDPNGDTNYTPVTETCGVQSDQMVDARIRITPHEATNVINANHTVNVIVESSTDGSTWSPVLGAAVHTSVPTPVGNHAVYVPNTAAAQDCTTSSHAGPSPPAGTYCQVTITDGTVETVNIRATATAFTVGSVLGTFTRSTGDASNQADCGNSDPTCGDAIKHWINPKTDLIVSDQLGGLGSDATGTVSYTAWIDDPTCDAGDPSSQKIDLGSTGVIVNGLANPSPNTVTVQPGHTVYFEAHYTGNEGTITTTCSAESATAGS